MVEEWHVRALARGARWPLSLLLKVVAQQKNRCYWAGGSQAVEQERVLKRFLQVPVVLEVLPVPGRHLFRDVQAHPEDHMGDLKCVRASSRRSQ